MSPNCLPKIFLPIYISIKYACFLTFLPAGVTCLLNFCHLIITLIYTLIISGVEHIFIYLPLYFFWELLIYTFCGSNSFTSCKVHQTQPNNQTHMTTISHILYSERYGPGDTVQEQGSIRHFSSLKTLWHSRNQSLPPSTPSESLSIRGHNHIVIIRV